MFSQFKLKQPIGSAYTMDAKDILATKKVLRALGHYKVPDHGMNAYADRRLLDGLKSFQQQQGLKPDGIMKPDGPTDQTLSKVLQSQWFVPRRSPRPEFPGNQINLSRKPQDLLDIEFLLRNRSTVDTDVSGKPYPPRPGAKPVPQSDRRKNRPGEKDVAFAPALIPPAIALGRMALPYIVRGLGLGTAVIAGKKAADEIQKRKAYPPRIPPIPPSEPQKNPSPEKEQYPATPPKRPEDLGKPIGAAIRNDPLIFQEVDDELRKLLTAPLESHRGDPSTQKGNRKIANDFIDRALEPWGKDFAGRLKHIGGAYDKEGVRQKETYKENSKTGGRKGSSNADLSFEDRVTKQKIHINTGKTLKDGQTLIAGERRQLKRLIKNAVGELVTHLPKRRPEMSEEDVRRMEDTSVDMLRSFFTGIYGPPPK